MADTLAGKVVLVTGGASGIGLATCGVLAREGAKLAVVDVNADGVEKTVADLKAAGCDAIAIVTDVSKEDQVERMVKTAVDHFGRLDGAFNNAGFGPKAAPVGEVDLDDWNRVFSVNMTGVMLCMKYEIRAMSATGGGAIVNMSSVAGLQGVPMQAAYSASKHGVLGLTKTASTEYAQVPIRVNAICAGVVSTPAYESLGIDYAKIVPAPMGRICLASEVGDVVAWLLSERSSFVTGQAITIDGGRIAASFVPA